MVPCSGRMVPGIHGGGRGLRGGAATVQKTSTQAHSCKNSCDPRRRPIIPHGGMLRTHRQANRAARGVLSLWDNRSPSPEKREGALVSAPSVWERILEGLRPQICHFVDWRPRAHLVADRCLHARR